MNKLLSDDSLNHSDKNNSKILETEDKPKGSVVIYGKSGRIVTLPPIEIPKTRSLVKKEVYIAIKKNNQCIVLNTINFSECRSQYKRSRKTKTFIRKVNIELKNIYILI